ncbi:HET-domain-containing protein [Hypoxylon cercidicola]|nr:HET-domain-containing protein [Hypoxylon cercidicola]
MKLLNTVTGDIKEFLGEDTQLEYAVLSHRWGDEEVSYQDWLTRLSRPDVRSRDGFRKIQHCCEQAKRDGFDWVWIDTCCIDKTSSQELSEAINSMFQLYRKSSMCYAYLRDYDYDTFDAARLEKCEWLFRGWTLQELIAPQKLDFYNRSWQRFGSKSDRSVCEAVSELSKIDIEFLLGADLESASIAKRMSWASRRKTTRSEDTAYCLMGIFDINMPLLYGEGPKAFKRLQEEIIKAYPTDHSLYAWGIPVDKCSFEVSAETVIEDNIETQFASSEPLYGLLAKSPQDFEYSRNYSPSVGADQFYNQGWVEKTPANYPTPIGKGVRIDLPVFDSGLFYYHYIEPPVSQTRFGYFGLLLCKDDADEEVMPCILLILGSSGYRSRHRELYLDRTPRPFSSYFDINSTLTVAPEKKPKHRAGDIILRSVVGFNPDVMGFEYYANDKEGALFDLNYLVQFRRDLAIRSVCITDYMLKENWGIVLGRVQTEGQDFPAFQAGIIAVCGPDINRFREEFICEKVFQSPSDEFTFDVDSMHEIKIRVNRRPLSEEGGFIDIVDIAVRIRSAQEETLQMAKIT